MTYDQIKKLDLSDVVISVTNLDDLVKECLSIVKTSTLKDNEIQLWIRAAIFDLKLKGINAEYKIQDPLIRGAIVMYVKANFGITDVKEKELAEAHYDKLAMHLSLSEDYRMVEDD